MMAKKLLSALLLVLPLAVSAQSSGAGYPMGNWQSGIDDNGLTADPYFVELWVERERDESGECGFLRISENKQDGKTLYEGQLTYAGRQTFKNVPTGVYYFDVLSKQGKASKIGVNKGISDMKIIVWSSGELNRHPAFTQSFIPCAMSMQEIPTLYAASEKELMESLRWALTEKIPVIGFGDVKQYINAHAKLDFTKPAYAMPKGTTAINIRKDCNTSTEKIGELKPNTTLQVVDEYNGWCQVKVADKQFGWVSLSVVTLTNTPAGTASASAVGAGSQETVCPLVGSWSGILGGGWGDSAISIKADKKAGNDAMNPSVVCNGSISMSDEDFINERHYFLQFNRTIAPGTYEFTAQLKVGKQMKSGKMQIKKSGNKIIMTGLDAWARQQPFHNKSLEVSNL